MTREADFLSGEVMEHHWRNDDGGGIATVVAKGKKKTKKAPKKGPKKKRKVKRPITTAPGRCQTGKKTCRLC